MAITGRGGKVLTFGAQNDAYGGRIIIKSITANGVGNTQIIEMKDAASGNTVFKFTGTSNESHHTQYFGSGQSGMALPNLVLTDLDGGTVHVEIV